MLWQIKEKAPIEFLEKFPEYPPLLLQLLWNRNLKEKKQIDDFLNPDYSQLHDPMLLPNIERAIERIKKALENKEKIIIWGDYDCDGICASTILYTVLKDLGVDERNIDVYIPDRNREGYGLNIPQLNEVIKNQASLIITVDCGITDFEEIEYANKFGVDIIVIDHHVFPEKRIAAYSIINPKDPASKYPLPNIAATAVVFKMITALLNSYDKNFLEKRNIKEGYEKWFLDLVCIATLADGMPLYDENRIFVKYGLFVISKTKRIGLKTLMKKCGLIPEIDEFNLVTSLNEWDLNFILIPRLNAMGRMEHASTSFELLNCISEEEALHLVDRLEFKNRERQNVANIVFETVENLISKMPKIPAVIFEGNKNWLPGILGFVCGKICEKYYRPVFLYSISNGVVIGSCRSIPEFNLAEALDKLRDLLIEGGGHPFAAGFKIKTENIEKFKTEILKYAENQLKEEDLTPKIEAEMEILPDEINFEIYDAIKSLAPFGKDNPKPIFILNNVEIADYRKVGNGENHLKMKLKFIDKETNIIKFFNAIGFGLSFWTDQLKIGDKINILFSLEENKWNGNRELELKIIDLKFVNN